MNPGSVEANGHFDLGGERMVWTHGVRAADGESVEELGAQQRPGRVVDSHSGPVDRRESQRDRLGTGSAARDHHRVGSQAAHRLLLPRRSRDRHPGDAAGLRQRPQRPLDQRPARDLDQGLRPTGPEPLPGAGGRKNRPDGWAGTAQND